MTNEFSRITSYDAHIYSTKYCIPVFPGGKLEFVYLFYLIHIFIGGARSLTFIGPYLSSQIVIYYSLFVRTHCEGPQSKVRAYLLEGKIPRQYI